jgi:hypothetical protein
MRVQIASSGGFAAIPGLAMEATLDLNGASGHVTTSDGSYTRDLSAQETQEVRGMLDPVSFFKLPTELRPLNESGPKSARSSMADQRQYDITIQSDEGREHTVTASEMMGDDLERMSPGLGKFLAWTKQEFARIKDQKIQQR